MDRSLNRQLGCSRSWVWIGSVWSLGLLNNNMEVQYIFYKGQLKSFGVSKPEL